MKFTLADAEQLGTPDDHTIAELVGVRATDTSRYSVSHVVAPAGSRGALRRNQFDTIIIVESGTGTVVRSYDRDTIEARDVVLLPAGTDYTIEADEDEALVFWSICVPAFRAEWSEAGRSSRDWRAYQVPRGSERLRGRMREQNDDR